MKKFLFLICLLGNHLLFSQQSTVCTDTLKYSELKEATVGSGSVGIQELNTTSEGKYSMAFTNADALTIHGIQAYVFSFNDTVVLQASVYSVNADRDPVNLLGTTTIEVISNGFFAGNVFGDLEPPVSVTGDYALVINIDSSSSNGLYIYTSDPSTGQLQDEDLARYTDNTLSGEWQSILEFSDSTYDYEPLIAPIVSYTLNADFTTTPSSTCAGTDIVFSSTSSPGSVLADRMMSLSAFIAYFLPPAADSTWTFDMGDGTDSLTASLTHNYEIAGNYTVELEVSGGLIHRCPAAVSKPILITDNYPNFDQINSVCINSTPPELPLTSLDGISGTWSPATVNTSLEGTITYTFTPAQNCSQQAIQAITVGECLGIEENIFEDLQIFPNPTAGEIVVSFTNQLKSAVTLKLLTGEGRLITERIIEAGVAADEKIDLSSVANGVYFINIHTEAGEVIKRVVRQ